MRIVSGTLGSRRVETLPGDTTRPTSDKIRGAIFNKIGPYFQDETFLDVFGGSGAMSFEAISRGMKHATILEMSPKALSVIKKNIDTLKIKSETKVLKGDARTLISTLKTPYDVVFMDPPYAYEFIEDVMKSIIDQELIQEDGWLIVETDIKKEVFESYKSWKCIKIKEYKATKVHYYVYEV